MCPRSRCFIPLKILCTTPTIFNNLIADMPMMLLSCTGTHRATTAYNSFGNHDIGSTEERSGRGALQHWGVLRRGYTRSSPQSPIRTNIMLVTTDAYNECRHQTTCMAEGTSPNRSKKGLCFNTPTNHKKQQLKQLTGYALGCER